MASFFSWLSNSVCDTPPVEIVFIICGKLRGRPPWVVVGVKSSPASLNAGSTGWRCEKKTTRYFCGQVTWFVYVLECACKPSQVASSRWWVSARQVIAGSKVCTYCFLFYLPPFTTIFEFTGRIKVVRMLKRNLNALWCTFDLWNGHFMGFCHFPNMWRRISSQRATELKWLVFSLHL